MSAIPTIPVCDDLLDTAAIARAPLVGDPFTYFVVPAAIRPAAVQAINRDYPKLPGPGAHPIEGLALGGAAADFWQMLNGERFRALMSDKLGLDLTGTTIMGTMRSACEPADGAIHTDSKTKIVTVLFYFNETWPHEGGRLRLLRSGTDLEDYAAEVEPARGAMLAFCRSERSWHGHRSFDGPRRLLQMHYADAKRVERNAKKRRSVGWRLKKLLSLG